MAMSLDPQSLGLQFGTGAVIGGLIGFAAKKIAKILAIIVGLELALFRFLEAKGYMSVRWDKLSGGVLHAGTEASKVGGNWIPAIISTLSVGAGFTGGFLLGFKRG